MNYQVNHDAPTVLTKIVSKRLERLTAMQAQYPAPKVLAKAQSLSQTTPHRSLRDSLLRGNPGFILECKKASPSKGVIRADFDPVAIAKDYQPYAAAISVLTEPDFFAGDFAYLQAVSAQVHLPILCKDFIVTEYQVALAKYFGAHAILLMLSILSDEQYAALAALAVELKLEILTEVSNEEEMRRATVLEAKIIGINNRNLRDLSVDLKQTEALAKLAPANAVLVAESGYESNCQIRTHAPLVDGFLVGSYLTAQADIDLACRKLIYGEHKLCGLTHPDLARVSAACGAVYGGLIAAERSPRKVSLSQAAIISQQVSSLNYVGVFSAIDPQFSAELVADWVRSAQLVAVQIHDLAQDHTQAQKIIKQLRDQLPARCEIWLATHLSEQSSTLPDLPVDRWLADHGDGGTGESFDWENLPSELSKITLAGGLGAHNVQQALATGCQRLDFNSKLEVAPGQKDPAKIRELFYKLRAYGRGIRTVQE